jgi:ABC-type nitrate/sulfonate/bicarbonate transport system permease component
MTQREREQKLIRRTQAALLLLLALLWELLPRAGIVAPLFVPPLAIPPPQAIT